MPAAVDVFVVKVAVELPDVRLLWLYVMLLGGVMGVVPVADEYQYMSRGVKLGMSAVLSLNLAVPAVPALNVPSCTPISIIFCAMAVCPAIAANKRIATDR